MPAVISLKQQSSARWMLRTATADLHAEFLLPTRPGTLRAHGRVVHRTKRTIFCAAELHDADGKHLASARCTQVVLEQR